MPEPNKWSVLRCEFEKTLGGEFVVKSLADLKLEIENSKSIDDLVMAIFFKSSQEKIPKSHAFLQRAFFSLKQEFPGLFTEFIFDESGVTPFSEELDSVLFRLEASAILSTLNPTFKNYIMTNFPEQFEKSYQKISSDFSEIDQCALLFSSLVLKEVV